MKYQERRAIAALGLVAVMVVGSGVNYARVLYTERKKRKKIEAWEREVLACIEASGGRLLQIVNGPDFSWDELIKAMREEDAFIDIVMNQPKY